MTDNCVHLYTGDGKGKTTAAVGLSVRACGAGKRVLFVQFLKGIESAEIEQLNRLGIEVIRTKASGKFVFQMDKQELEQCRSEHCECFKNVVRLINTKAYDMVVLDEITDAVELGIIDKQMLIALLKEKPAELVLTGHYLSDDMLALCDYVSEVKKIKHPYDEGLKARQGIEF